MCLCLVSFLLLLTVDCNSFQESQQLSDTEQQQARFCYAKYMCREQSPSYTADHLVMICIYSFCKFHTFDLQNKHKINSPAH